MLLVAALGVTKAAGAEDVGGDAHERQLRCFSESHIELRFSLDPKSRLKSPAPTARYIAYQHDDALFPKKLALATSNVTDEAITASLVTSRKVRFELALGPATSVVSAGGDCYRVTIATTKGTLTLPNPIFDREGEERIPAGRGPVTCLLETQFESRCE